MSSVDVSKFQAAISSFADQIDVLKGGVALTGEELITNGISQLDEIEIIIENKNPTSLDSDDEATEDGEYESSSESYEEAKEIAEKIQEALLEVGLEDLVNITYTSNYVRMTLSGEVLFDSGSASIKDDSLYVVTAIGDIITENGYDQYLIQVEGHTDNVPVNSLRYPNNWYLSSARAIGVGMALIEQFEFDPEQISCLGYGEYRPIADNTTAEGRSINRRVEIKIIVEKEEILLEETLEETTEEDLTTEVTPIEEGSATEGVPVEGVPADGVPVEGVPPTNE
jgi:chemotaxis protein MotB